ncbi:hypothetical protein CCR75_000834 [Bremia lactucae]|uniref:Uncharacterized protein n=1 Tax=Bremia lactucae TaxID=4779 RepID=A0A976FNM7_BRELC|nr:hypothetical protein CCR75_000834 [Bremia lactucae]
MSLISMFSLRISPHLVAKVGKVIKTSFQLIVESATSSALSSLVCRNPRSVVLEIYIDHVVHDTISHNRVVNFNTIDCIEQRRRVEKNKLSNDEMKKIGRKVATRVIVDKSLNTGVQNSLVPLRTKPWSIVGMIVGAAFSEKNLLQLLTLS